MSHPFRNILRSAAALIVVSVFASCNVIHVSPFEEDLRRLDEAIAMEDEYVLAKEQKIRTVENMLHSRGVADLQKYHIYGQLFDEYEAYQFDKAKEMVEHQEELARSLGSVSLLNDALLDKALLYINAGLYLETEHIFEQFDTLTFDLVQKIEWYNVRQKYLADYDEYVRSSSVKVDGIEKVNYYQDQILANTPESSEENLHIRVLRLISQEDFEKAYNLNKERLSSLDRNTRQYAIRAYWQGAICDRQGNTLEAVHWWTESAICDIRSAIKDNASLSSLAQQLVSPQDSDRAFRYIRFSLDDAVFYNAKLRKVQIASVFPMIEKAYTDSKAERDRERKMLLNWISATALLLLVLFIFAIRLFFKTRLNSREIENKNEQLAESYKSIEAAEEGLKLTNLKLIEANAAKEEYLGLFLSMCSGYLDKLKKALGRDQYEAELRNFYKTFDTSFLQLYPTFVEEFNSLLKEEERITLKDGESLNTELRIFALIKLGITQSSHIASLLRYSVNTIYNYRAQVKNAALSDRENFEETVRKIGSKRV